MEQITHQHVEMAGRPNGEGGVGGGGIRCERSQTPE